ncbi:SURF1 family protein [Chitinimonas sp.]|uniref:SURF1 family protein n=1 Tax=Chitinimonas sp. TaxID=1934313 RepID=UPI0035B0901D
MALTIRLGLWQLERGRAKTQQAQLQQQFDAAPLTPWQGEVGESVWQRRFLVSGSWYPQGQILLDNRVHHAIAGYYVLTPLLMDDGRLLPVVRGWVARGSKGLPAIAPVSGRVSLNVRMLSPEQRFIELAKQTTDGTVWQNYQQQRYSAWLGRPVVAALAYQLEGKDELARDWPRPDFGADRHYGYAGQWFLFAGLALVLFLYFHWKTKSNAS